MSSFSDLLKQHITERHLSVRKFAAEIDLDRTLLQKYLSGDRKPKSQEEVLKIAHTIPLTVTETHDLMIAYFESIYGDRTCADFLKIKEMLEGIENYQINSNQNFSISIDGQDFLEIRNTEEDIICTGALQVEYELNMLLAEACKENPSELDNTIYAAFQPCHQHLMKALMMHTVAKQFPVEQLICLEQNRENNGNLSMLLPVLAHFMNNSNYCCKYYYDNVKAHLNSMTAFPVILITSKAAFLCNDGCDYGYIIRKKEFMDFLRHQYNFMAAASTNLGVPHLSDRNEGLHCGDYNGVGCRSEFFGATPVLRIAINAFTEKKNGTVRDVSGEQSDRLIQEYLNSNTDITEYFGKKHLREFLEEGTFSGCNAVLADYATLTLTSRISVVKKLIELNKRGILHSHMSNPTYVNISRDTLIIADSNHSDVEIKYVSKERCVSALLGEPCLCNTLHSFGQFVIDNNWFHTQAETISYMEELVTEFEGRAATM